MSIEDVVREAVGEEYEFWRQGAHVALLGVARFLDEKGLEFEEAVEVISTVWSAASQEYGA